MNVLNKLRFFQIYLIDQMKQEDVWKTFYDGQNCIDLDCSLINTDDNQIDLDHECGCGRVDCPHEIK